MSLVDSVVQECQRAYWSMYASMRFPPVGDAPASSPTAATKPSQAPWFFTYDYFAGYRAPVPLAFMGGMFVLYFVVVYVLAPIARPSDPKATWLSWLRWAHNVCLCLFSGLCFVSSTYHMVDSGELFDVRSMLCATTAPSYIVHLNIAFIASKVWEWMDSVLLVWSAKDLSKLNFLHVYHHATTLWLFAIVANFPACTKMGMVLNGGVHTFMYLHYARPLPRAFVPMLTAAQIGQLAFTVFMWVRTPSVCGGRFAAFAFDEHPWVYATPYLMVPVYLAFFVRFFVRRYVTKSSHHHAKKLMKPKTQ